MNRNWKTVFCAAIFAVVAFTTETMSGQAIATADQKAQISVFGGGSYVQPQPDFYTNNQKAYLFGADYTRYLHRFYVDPSLEIRALISPLDEEVGENVYSGGLKVEHAYGRFHPYGDFLVGTGTIKYNPVRYHNERSDNSVVLTYGGGVDVEIWKGFGLKADYQGSHWHTGSSVYFHPRSENFAVVYRFGRHR